MVWGSAQKELGRQPPIGDVNGFRCLIQCHGDGPEVVAAVDIPFDQVSLSLRKVGLVTMGLAYFRSFLVALDFMLFIVAMVVIELRRAPNG
jgi:hypothetical protein